MTSKERILDAAISVFARKGRHGARMEEIASLAHINKAMIYYFYHSKDNLYFEILRFVLFETSISLSEITDEAIKSGHSYEHVLSIFISAMISFYSKNTYYTRILIEAMASGTEEISLAISEYKDSFAHKASAGRFKEFLEEGKAENIIRDIDTDHLIISIIGMAMVYFFSRSITESFEIEVTDEKHFLEQRKNSIIDLVLNSIIIKDNKNLNFSNISLEENPVNQ